MAHASACGAIARLNIGGPTIQALSLTKLLAPLGYETVLIPGVEGVREGSMDEFAANGRICLTRFDATWASTTSWPWSR
jgi:hypothetical protein